MNGYTIKPDFDPNDNYQKAYKDCIQAFESVSKLNQQQQQKLLNDLCSYASFKNFIDRYFNHNI